MDRFSLGRWTREVCDVMQHVFSISWLLFGRVWTSFLAANLSRLQRQIRMEIDSLAQSSWYSYLLQTFLHFLIQRK